MRSSHWIQNEQKHPLKYKILLQTTGTSMICLYLPLMFLHYTIYSVTIMDQCVQDRKQNCRHSVFGKFPEKGTAMAWKQWYKEEGGIKANRRHTHSSDASAVLFGLQKSREQIPTLPI